MKYQLVKDSSGNVVAFGPNDGMYEPTLKNGEVLEVVNEKEAELVIKEFLDQTQIKITTTAAARQSALAKLADLGLTAEEIAAL